MKVREKNGKYLVIGTKKEITGFAASLLEKDLLAMTVLDTPDKSSQFLTCKLGGKEREVFACLFLDNQHRVQSYEELFQGTIDGTSVYPREVVKAALRNNSAAVVLAHNHPSGTTKPSPDDERITGRLKEALSLVDVRVLDHIVVGGNETYSFAEAGKL